MKWLEVVDPDVVDAALVDVAFAGAVRGVGEGEAPGAWRSRWVVGRGAEFGCDETDKTVA